MKNRIDSILSKHVIEDVAKKWLSPWRMLFHIWLIVTRREKLTTGICGICREFRG